MSFSSSRTRPYSPHIRSVALAPLGRLSGVGIASHAAVLRQRGRLALIRLAAEESAGGFHRIMQRLGSDQ